MCYVGGLLATRDSLTIARTSEIMAFGRANLKIPSPQEHIERRHDRNAAPSIDSRSGP
jgi:hypothetical protein